ncbi:MAG: hypothetical protein COS99_02205 [Candidatus Omnitrophica bacterium CG07_land_8_20_14_0_80_42_15]|uniref:3-deoxy-manno-octulosonate-8-phosphatase n=1 Tax=Candidatus Aquitaenariimonas noxiae TaxID=1974741 RepID=A0A2J0KU48_9BACT|nr:MAG: hypothetical protein COS99_02205 [Candidatus Omnitrophica bacterium CG07_land_8_20_14_0_80_42_15]
MDARIIERAKKIKLLITDVDGILTDGRIVYGNYGDELKFFDVQDGLGLALLKRADIKVAIITAKKSKVVKMRARELGISALYQNCRDKLKVFNKLVKKYRITPEEVCFIGDDLIDISPLKRAGLAVSVPNAVEEARSSAHLITTRKGGRGAVREVCDLILKSSGKWEAVTGKYFK